MKGFLAVRLALARFIAPEAFQPTPVVPEVLQPTPEKSVPKARAEVAARFGVAADLLALVEMFSKHTDRAEATIAHRIGSHARLFSRLRAGHGCTLKTAATVTDWFDANWPDDLEWPADVLRPSTLPKQKRRAA